MHHQRGSDGGNLAVVCKEVSTDEGFVITPVHWIAQKEGDSMATVMKRSTKTQLTIAQVLDIGKQIAQLGDEDVRLSYDREANVLYVNFANRQKAIDAVALCEKGVLLRYRGRKLVSITVLEESKR